MPLLALVGVTVVWGGTFVVVKDVTRQTSPLDFLAVRFLIATAVLLVLRPRRTVNPGPTTWRHGILLGLMLCGAYIAQTYGQQYTSASISGFITGLAVMSIRDFTVGPGEGLTLLCAVFLAMHIVGLGEWSKAGIAYDLTLIQVGVVGVVCLGLGASDGISLPMNWSFWVPVIGLAVLATAAAYLVQTWAQARLPASAVAIVLTLEPVFAGVFGVVVDGDDLTFRVVPGALLVLVAMYLVELRPRALVPSR